jgi:hypothetical protein
MKKLIYLIPVFLILFNCRKSHRDEDKDLTAAEDYGRMEIAYNNVFMIVDEAAKATQGIRAGGSLITCATITSDTLSNPKTMDIDFGTVNCVGADGRNRRGKIHVALSGNYMDSLTVATITFQNYYTNDYLLAGTQTITNRGRNSSGNYYYSIAVSNGLLTEPTNAWYITYNASRAFEWIAGSSTLTATDDIYSITGSMSGVGRKGNSFSGTISSALRFETTCGTIVSGNLDLTPNNLNARQLDFGSGTCDNSVQVTVNGFAFDISLQ